MAFLLFSALPTGPLTLSLGISQSRNLSPATSRRLGGAGPWALGRPLLLISPKRTAWLRPAGECLDLPERTAASSLLTQELVRTRHRWLFSKDLEAEWIKERIQIKEQSVQEEPALFPLS